MKEEKVKIRSSAIAGLWLDLKRPFHLCGAGLIVISFLFSISPQLDLAVSSWFYDPQLGFQATSSHWAQDLRSLGLAITRFTAFTLAIAFLAKLIAPFKITLAWRKLIFLMTSLAIGPGLIVHVLKDTWGRARPRQISEFGGSLDFTTAWQLTDQCAKNCSFVSGEAAAAIWWLALAIIVPPNLRKVFLITAGTLAIAISINRIAFGGHFLSDILLAWCITGLVIIACYRLIMPPTEDCSQASYN